MQNALIITADDVANALPMKRCIAAVEDAFRQLGAGTAQPPALLSVHTHDGAFHIKAGVLATDRGEYFAAKTNGNFPNNPGRNGLPTIQGVAVLCDASDGRVLALIDSGELTARRTGAATGVAAKYLANSDASIATICGCGVQAPAQLEALASVLPLRMVYAFDTNPARAQDFALRMSQSMGLAVEVSDNLKNAVAQSDVCVTCTPSREFILDAGDVHDGMFIAGVGVDNEHKRELSPALLARARVVPDVTAQCELIGDLHHAIQAGAVTRTDMHAELGAIVAGIAQGRSSKHEIFVFDSTGMALQDVAAAAAIYEHRTA